jgi:hypothetical protein
MEKEKKGISCSYAVLVIILFAALAFVVDYAVIERKLNKCSCPDCAATANTNVVTDDTQSNSSNTSNSEKYNYALYTKYGEFIVTKNGDVYCNSLDGIDMNNSNIFTKGSVEVNYDLISMREEDTIFDGYKLNISDVRSIYSYYYGQQGDSAIVFIKNDGTIGALYITLDGMDKYVKLDSTIDGFTNIITAVSNSAAGGSSILTIDKDGNMKVLPTYLSSQIKN